VKPKEPTKKRKKERGGILPKRENHPKDQCKAVLRKTTHGRPEGRPKDLHVMPTTKGRFALEQ
jgi:hypothetical protein